MTDLEDFRREIHRAYPALARSFDEATSRGGDRLRRLADLVIRRYGEFCLDDPVRLVRSLANLVMEVNKLQLKYEISGHYQNSDYERALTEVYCNEQRMTDYMLALACTQFAWPNHFNLFCFFEDEFLQRIKPRQVLEVAPGHGLFGLTLLERHSSAMLTGVDISPASIQLSRRVAQCFGLTHASYIQGNALQLSENFGTFDTVICGELMEHLPDPLLLCRSVARALTDEGVAYVTAAITAAAPDHIYEFESEEEVLSLFKAGGLNVELYRCFGTRALTERAKGVPRTLAAILRKNRAIEV